MLRRPPTRRETAWAVVGLVAIVLVSTYAVLFWTNWPAAPVRSGLVVGLMVVGLLVSVPFVRADRADPPANLGLVDVERSARWPLRRELWAGRPGPVELRRYAVGWATRKMEWPARGPTQIWLGGWLMAQNASYGRPDSDAWVWLISVLPLVLVATGVVSLVLRRRAEQVVDALERESDHEEVPADR
ncbi:hypothetical protein LQ327_29490 [Actinomycetospora endophytica]|uniref:Uncharacterized protein n=1 Tax=Actinomycetospora endophytica TaxID=2291215 RepID=A0ABS8PHU9_9PSEU|nr:hypothetical protein [Actinomycetospora endophytica]MCD2197512.1 hypothetical protein [Actinomycetospora endophytica]